MPVACSSGEWAEWIENAKSEDRRVCLDTDEAGTLEVSTVFVGVDQGTTSRPQLFETMVFDHDENVHCMRYATWEEAWEGHQAIASRFIQGAIIESASLEVFQHNLNGLTCGNDRNFTCCSQSQQIAFVTRDDVGRSA